MKTPVAIRLFANVLVLSSFTMGFQLVALEAQASSLADDGRNKTLLIARAQVATSCEIPVVARITRTGERFVEIDIGTDDGVKRGSTFHAFMGSTKIRLKVVSVSRNYSACTSSMMDHEMMGLQVKRALHK